MEMNITWYKDCHKEQVIKLFAAEYGLDPVSFGVLFERFYLHPFQKNKCLLIVALDGETVAGFQSFFYWPYTFGGKTWHSFQSGNSLVHPAHRGKGLFNKMLAFIDKENKTADIDFLMGFPVQASLKNFLKDKWENILNLRWYVKPCNPLAFSSFSGSKGFAPGCENFGSENPEQNVLRLSRQSGFTDWRKEYLAGSYYSFRYTKGEEEIIFHLKPNKRKKVLNELVIGNILFSNEKAQIYLFAALKKLAAAAGMTFGVHFLSLALNEACSLNFAPVLKQAGFKRSKRSIYFIAKPFKDNQFVLDPANWLLFRSDIDTW